VPEADPTQTAGATPGMQSEVETADGGNQTAGTVTD